MSVASDARVIATAHTTRVIDQPASVNSVASRHTGDSDDTGCGLRLNTIGVGSTIRNTNERLDTFTKTTRERRNSREEELIKSVANRTKALVQEGVHPGTQEGIQIGFWSLMDSIGSGVQFTL